MGKAGEKQKRHPKIKDKKQSERFKETARELGAEEGSDAFGRIIEQMGRAMPDHIRANKLPVFGLLQGIENAVAKGDHKTVEKAREKLSLIAHLEIARSDELGTAVMKVFELSGQWDRRTLPDGGLAEIRSAVQDAIRLLNT